MTRRGVSISLILLRFGKRSPGKIGRGNAVVKADLSGEIRMRPAGFTKDESHTLGPLPIERPTMIIDEGEIPDARACSQIRKIVC